MSCLRSFIYEYICINLTFCQKKVTANSWNFRTFGWGKNQEEEEEEREEGEEEEEKLDLTHPSLRVSE